MEKVCCRCKRNQDGDRWIRQKISKRQDVSYGFCPNCYQATMVQIAKAYEFRNQKIAVGGVN